MDVKLIEAARATSGCNGAGVLRRVIWPLSLPGVLRDHDEPAHSKNILPEVSATAHSDSDAHRWAAMLRTTPGQ